MFKKMIKHLKDCLKKGVDIYMNGQEIKAKTLVESLEIGADLLKSAGRGMHTTIHEIIDGISNLAKKTTETKENCLMTAVISAGVGVGALAISAAVSVSYFIRANSFDKI